MPDQVLAQRVSHMVQLGEGAAAQGKAKPRAQQDGAGAVRSIDQLAGVAGLMEERAGRRA